MHNLAYLPGWWKLQFAKWAETIRRAWALCRAHYVGNGGTCACSMIWRPPTYDILLCSRGQRWCPIPCIGSLAASSGALMGSYSSPGAWEYNMLMHIVRRKYFDSLGDCSLVICRYCTSGGRLHLHRDISWYCCLEYELLEILMCVI